MLRTLKVCACHRVFANLEADLVRSRTCSTSVQSLQNDPQKTLNVSKNRVAKGGNARPHIPVMLEETLEMLEPTAGQVFVDMTFGAGGHTEAILNAADETKIYALDRDPVAFQYAKEMALKYRGRVFPMLGRFSDLDQMFHRQGVPRDSIDGFLFDVGASSMQMDDRLRGFSISKNGPLDMRMDGERVSNRPTARDVINTLDESSLGMIFKVYGEEKAAYQIASAITQAKYLLKNINTTEELASLIEATLHNDERVDKLRRPAHVATKVFQALRIFVNNELNELNHGIKVAYEYLRPGGTMVALTFHSLEDRIVKRHILGIDMDEPAGTTISMKYKNAGKWMSKEELQSIYSHYWTSKCKGVIVPSDQEVAVNPRSRSAKLRAAVKTK